MIFKILVCTQMEVNKDKLFQGFKKLKMPLQTLK